MTKTERELDDLFMSISVSEMILRSDRTPADLERFATKLRMLSFEVERIARHVKDDAA
jgi:hypothetical protein